MAYICEAYKGNRKPEACRSLSSKIDYSEKAKSAPPGCYVDEATRFTSLTTPEKIPTLAKANRTQLG